MSNVIPHMIVAKISFGWDYHSVHDSESLIMSLMSLNTLIMMIEES